jgi:hypothetical protein
MMYWEIASNKGDLWLVKLPNGSTKEDALNYIVEQQGLDTNDQQIRFLISPVTVH